MKLLKDKKVIYSGLFFIVMLMLVMLLFNPMIDGGNGMGLIDLQLSFDKFKGIEVVNAWGENGVTKFNQWIFTDYIYALSYALFFSSLLVHFNASKGQQKIPYFAALFDGFEDTIELFFINNQEYFPQSLFMLHSVFAVIKFILIPWAIFLIVNYWLKNKSPTPR